jgi:hypothetical protein
MTTTNTGLQSQILATNSSTRGAVMVYALMRRRKMFILDEAECPRFISRLSRQQDLLYGSPGLSDHA